MKRYHETVNKRSRLITAPAPAPVAGSPAALASFDPDALKARIAEALRIQNDYYPCFDWTFPPPISPRSREPVDADRLFRGPSVVSDSHSVYVHVPFCATLCRFCYYPVIPGSESQDMERYVNALVREMALVAPSVADRDCESIYIGGGTPTYLGDRLLARLLEALFSHFKVRPDAEVTIESAPGTVPPERLALLAGLGVTRLSYGIQSLDERMLATLNRNYTVAGAMADISEAVKRIGNVNVDTMYGFDDEPDDALVTTLEWLIGLGVPGVSIYSLDPQRCDHERVRFLPARDVQHRRKLEIFRKGAARLASEGFEAVLQNIFVQPARASYRHQLSRWENVPLVALGLSAMGYAPRMIYQNHLSLKQYYQAIDEGRLPVAETESLSPELEMARELVSCLRFTRVDFKALNAKYGIDLLSVYGHLVTALAELGYLAVDGGVMRLTTQAAPYNNIIPMLFTPDAFKRILFDLPEEYRDQFPLPYVLTRVGATQSAPVGL